MDIQNALKALPTPCYVIDEAALIKNLETLSYVEEQTGCHVLLAQKAFSAYRLYPLIANYISGTTASGIFEARLAHEEMGNRQVHVFSPAYKDEDFDELVKICDHIVFNSFSQWKHFRRKALEHPEVEYGLRINPEYSEIETDIYNPCFTNSRLGITLANFEEDELEGISGLHFHTMCEQGSDTLERTLKVVVQRFGKYFSRMKWINFGGGHHITRPGYDVQRLIACINDIKNRYGVQVYIEPGEAVALNAGWLVTSVLDLIKNNMDIAIVDTSAACHMPDVLEMPYRPMIVGSGKAGEFAHTYRLGAPTCLAGDVIGDYSFEKPLSIGDKLVFTDMAIYSMVKNNTFNGLPLPSVFLLKSGGSTELLKKFGYEDFKSRL
ncbi:MAG: carboxynorspermidine decarboxylase [Clostridia bacterium]|nr:carboxynorspermidine decarboxylase [Clostridia bacterium]